MMLANANLGAVSDSDLLIGSEEEEGDARVPAPPLKAVRRGAAAIAVVVAGAFVLCAARSTSTVGKPRLAANMADSHIKQEAGGSIGGATFATGPANEFKTFGWGKPQRALPDAWGMSFPNGGGWHDVEFTEGGGGVMTRDRLLHWLEKELLSGPDPFAEWGGAVPVPFPQQGWNHPDQLPPGHWVMYSRRQLCFITAKTLLGSGTNGYNNGFLRFLGTKAGGCSPQTGEFGKALWYLLAACAADPGLAGGAQGPGVIVTKANPEPSVEQVRAAAEGVPLTGAGLRVCQYNDGAEPIPGVERVPEEGCAQPTANGAGRDFMTGGLNGQGLADISAQWLGGYIWGYACGIGGGQDERLMTSMPEVFLLAFFLSESPGTNPQQKNTPQLRQPAWILGARKVFQNVDGTGAFFNAGTLTPDSTTPLTSDLTSVSLAGRTFDVSTATPFLAFMSENQDYEISNGCSGLPGKIQDRGQATRLARDNRNPFQRAVDGRCPFAFDKQVRAWYGATALSMYVPDVQPALRAVVKSLGTGPWGSGLWWGDSQVMMLAMWLGHAAAAATWGDKGLPLDYYLYSAFTENPGNQCFVHSGDQCKACLAQCGTPPEGSYWLPGFAYSGTTFTGWGPAPPPAKACVVSASSCGGSGIADVVAAYGDETASTLWADTEKALRGGASAANVGANVFDILVNTKNR